ncbi:MAG: EAL domain-containing protein [Actinomycetota bacterium]
MSRVRTEIDEQVAELLRTAKRSLGLSLTFLSRMDGVTQHLEVVESTYPFFKDGQTQRQDTSFCQAILDGELPKVIPDVTELPDAMQLPAARFPRIRSFVSVPVVLSDGSVYGTFCAAGFRADQQLADRDQALMEVLASATATIIEPSELASRHAAEIHSRLDPIMQRGGPTVVLQPIVALRDGLRVGAEALSRFPAEWDKAPDVVFDEAAEIDVDAELQMLALRRAADHLETVGGYVAMNVSPKVLLDPRCLGLLDDLPAERILLELSDHDPVEDYDALAVALAPLRAAGMRLAIDDVGAGFSSLRHIVLTGPDVIKLDRSIVNGVTADTVLRTLLRSLVEFGRGCGAAIVAEGIETVDDATTLTDLGVDLGQGWFFGRPGPAEALRDHYEIRPGRGDPVIADGRIDLADPAG